MMYNEIILNDIKEHLIYNNDSLAVAESVTSGHLQAAFSASKEASLFFQGGITTYNLGQKSRHLGIEPIHAQECNCISPIVARHMALNVCELFLSNFGIGITGYATKLPEKGINSLFAFYAVSYNKEIILNNRITSEKDSSVDVQIDFTNQVLHDLFEYLHNRPKKENY